MSSSSTTWTTDTNTKSGVVQIYESNVSVLKILGIEGGNSILELFADQGDDNADKWRMWVNASDDDLHFANYTSGAWADLLTIQDGGNVGIGTSSPGFNLDIRETTAGSTGQLMIDHTDTSNTSSGSKITMRTGAAGGGDPHLGFIINGVDEWCMGIDNSDSDKFKISDAGTLGSNDRLVIDTSGNVGIGTASPEAELEILSSTTTDLFIRNTTEAVNQTSRLQFLSGASGNADTERVATIKALVESDGGVLKGQLQFRTNTGDSETTKMTIDAAGNVCIGGATPTTFHADLTGFQIGGNGILTHETAVGASKTLKIAQNVREEITSGDFTYISTDEASFIELSSGGLAVKTAPSGSADATATMTERFRILEGGNVGIGDAAPAVNLEVNDTTLASGESTTIRVSGTGAAGSEAYCQMSVLYHSSQFGTNQACTYFTQMASDGSIAYLWLADDDDLMGSTTSSNIGTTTGVVVGASLASDERLKDISGDSFPYGLSDINKITPIKYKRKKGDARDRLGFGAQTIQPIIPESVQDTKECIHGYTTEEQEGKQMAKSIPKGDPSETKLVMEYHQIIPVLVKAIQELSAKVTALENA